MAESEHVRLEIAFDGGQIMGALVTLESADELERALGDGADGTIALALLGPLDEPPHPLGRLTRRRPRRLLSVRHRRRMPVCPEP